MIALDVRRDVGFVFSVRYRLVSTTQARAEQSSNLRHRGSELGLVQPPMRPTGLQQLSVRPLLHDLAGLHHHDVVDVADGGGGGR